MDAPRTVGSVQSRDIGVLGRIEQQATPLAEAVAGWTSYLEGRHRKPRSIASFRGLVEAAARDCGWTAPEQITFEAVTGWMSSHPWKATTYNRNLSAFRSFCRWLVASDRLDRDPLALAHNLEADGDFGARAATVEEAREVIRDAWIRQQTDGRARGQPALYYLCLFSMGLRVGEPERWVWGDLHLDEPIPFIVWRPEINKNRRRQIVPIPAEAAILLNRLRQTVDEEQNRGNESTDSMLRIGSIPVFPVVPSRTSFRAARDRCGIPAKDARGYGFSPHSARKYLESILAGAGVQQTMVDRLMRHAGGVSARYFDPSLDEMAAALNRAPSLWPEKVVGITQGALTADPNIVRIELPDGDRAQAHAMQDLHSNPTTPPTAASREPSPTSTTSAVRGVVGFEQGANQTSEPPMPRGGSHLTVDRSSPRYVEALELLVTALLLERGRHATDRL